MGPDPAVAAVRLAVRRVLAGLPPGEMVLVACSGGADSLALAGAAAFEAPRCRPEGRPAGAVTVDHGLQAGSQERAAALVRTLADLGLDPAGSVAVVVGQNGGPENAAREARYTALDEAASRLKAAAVLLGHTRDDQAETVLMGLARGSGARSIAGMPPSFVRRDAKSGTDVLYLRPFLDLDRATTRRACEAMGLTPWDDPHNVDRSYTRVRVRHEALPALEKALGPGIAEALARTGKLLRDDADALDEMAARCFAEALTPPAETGGDLGAAPGPDDPRTDGVGLDVKRLEDMPRAIRTRVLRTAAIRAGSPPGTLAAVHVEEVERLVTAWRGQRYVDLPGGVRAFRRYGRLLFGPSSSPRRRQGEDGRVT